MPAIDTAVRLDHIPTQTPANVVVLPSSAKFAEIELCKPMRLFEWIMGGAMAAVAACVLLIAMALLPLTPAGIVLSASGPGAIAMALLIAAAAAMRLYGLKRNGEWSHSAKMRFVGCLGGAILWLHLMWLHVLLLQPIEAVVYAGLCVGEGFSIWRAGFDDGFDRLRGRSGAGAAKPG